MLLYTCDTVLIYFIAQADGERLPIQLGVKIISFFPIFVGKGGGMEMVHLVPTSFIQSRQFHLCFSTFFHPAEGNLQKLFFLGAPVLYAWQLLSQAVGQGQ